MDQIANATLPPGTGYEWTAMSYQENVVGNQMLYVFALAILLVYLCLAGQYESWIAPLARDPRRAAGAGRPGHRARRARASPTTSTPRSA